MRRIWLSAILFASAPAVAEPVMSYSGRVVDEAGKPVVGPVDVEVRFFDDDLAGSQRGPTSTFPATKLHEGVFQVDVDLGAGDVETIFGNGTTPVFLELRAAGKPFARQRVLPVPYALRIPIDPARLAFENGLLTVKTDNLGDLTLGTQATLGLGAFSDTQEATLVGTTPAVGSTWYNSTINQIKYWNGTVAATLGTAGSGLTSLNGLGALNQSLAVDHTGTSLSWGSVASTHTLHVPLASAGVGVTGGLISNGDYVSFTNKADRSGDTLRVAAGTEAVPTLASSADTGNDTGIFWPGTPAGNNFAVTTAGTERLRVDASGNLGIGTPTPEGLLHVSSSGATHVYVDRYDSIVAGPTLALRKARGTASSPLAVQAGDTLSNISARGHDGTSFSNATSSIRSYAAQNWTPAQQGSYLSFHTTPNGSPVSSIAERMRLTDEGRVGIGSASPQSLLDVAGTITATGLKLTASPTNGHVLTSDPAGNATWQAPVAPAWGAPGAIGATTPSTGAFSGVSIGTTAAGTDLFFGSGADRTITVQTQATAGDDLTVQAGGTSGTNVNGGDLILSSGTANGSGNSKIEFKTANGGAPVTSMTILGNGNVGIGTTAPTSSLEVVSNIPQTLKLKTGSADHGYVEYFTDAADQSSRTAYVGFPSVGSEVFAINNQYASGQIGLYTGGSPRMMINTAGNVGIGTTGPNNLLQIGDTGHTGYGLAVQAPGAGQYGAIVQTTATDGNAALWVRNSSSGISHFRVQNDGKVGIGSASPTAKLDVAGEIKLGNTSSTCDATREGQQRYNSTTKAMEFCNGTVWKSTQSGGFIDYSAGSSVTYDTVTQAASNGYLVVVAEGSFMNGVEVVVGPTSTPATVVGRMGDDINGNTKAHSLMIPIPSGYYYRVRTVTVGASSNWPYESVTSTFYPVQ